MSPFGKQHYWAAITDASGLRTSKTVGNITTHYYWLGDKLQAQRTGNDYLIFLYDEASVPYGLIHKYGSTEKKYYYEYNLQGDIIGIISDAGTRVVTYQYSAWGELLSISGSMASNIGADNPLRYRGYYYDEETGFYYLQSRYYDPVTCRFINEDSLISTGQGVLGYNMFAYCINDPVGRKDTQGTSGISVALDDEGNPLDDLGSTNVRGSTGSNSGGLNNGYGKYAGGSVPNKSNKPISPEKVSDAYIKQNNIDAHGFKNQAGGVPRSMLSKYDIYKDKANNGMLWVGTKQFTDWRITNYYFKDLTMVWMKD